MKKKIKLTPQKRQKQKNKLYFTTEHEEAIKLYSTSFDPKVKNNLYCYVIEPVFNEMINKMVFTFKFTTLPNIEELKEECKAFLITILGKFKPEKGFKAFSYFSVITKNWFIHKIKKNAIQFKKEIGFDELEQNNSESLLIYNNFVGDKNKEDFFCFLTEEMDLWEKFEELKQNEKQVLSAIQVLFKNPDSIEIFNKKAIFIYLRELSRIKYQANFFWSSKIKKKI